ncbi:MAG: glycosyltransferase family 9 protein [Gemmataceae bacterium]|nr:glycosyltransferase family 9 protein [Gemmataceae bacterium]
MDFEPRRIALIKPSALGDIMHSLPVLTALRQRFPKAHIAWVVNRLYEPLLRGHPHLDAVISFDRSLGRGGCVAAALGFGRLLRALRRERFDCAIDLQGLLRSGLMTFATRAKLRVGLASAREGAGLFYNRRVDDRHGVAHAVDRYWRVAVALGAGVGAKQFVLPLAADAQHWARAALDGKPRPWLAIGVGARWPTKRWPPEHFARLVQRALDKFGGTAIFVGSADETMLTRRAVNHLSGNVLDFTGKTTLPQLAAILAESDVMLANDTGPLHMAVALGRPVVAPYTCTLVERTGPYGHYAAGAAATSVWCRGSYLKRCDRLECMDELTPDRLWIPLHDLLLTCLRHRQSA